MNSTGIIRRVDDLGRVVIPKEIRRTLGIREGEALEIFVENGASKIVAFRKVDCGITEQLQAVRERMLEQVCENGDHTEDDCATLNAMFSAIEILFNNIKKGDNI